MKTAKTSSGIWKTVSENYVEMKESYEKYEKTIEKTMENYMKKIFGN